MHLDSVGQVLAERVFDLQTKGRTTQVRVLFGTPAYLPGTRDHFCAYQVLGLGDEVVRYAGGVDAAQAIYLAMEAVGTYLAATREASLGQLTWYGEKTLGLPLREQRRKLSLVASR